MISLKKAIYSATIVGFLLGACQSTVEGDIKTPNNGGTLDAYTEQTNTVGDGSLKKIFFMKPPGWQRACLHYSSLELGDSFSDIVPLEMVKNNNGYYYYELVDPNAAYIKFSDCLVRAADDPDELKDPYSTKSELWQGNLWVYSDERWYHDEPHLDNNKRIIVDPYPIQAGAPLSVTYLGPLPQAEVKAIFRYNGGEEVDGHSDSCNYYYCEEKMVGEVTVEGVKFTTVLPANTRAAFWSFVVEKDNEVVAEDDNYGEEYVFSTLPLFMGPYLTLAGNEADLGTAIAVNFVTDLPRAAQVQYGLDKNLGQSTEMTYNERYHHHKLVNLSPETTYFYRVILDDGRVSPTYNFKTPHHLDDPDFGFVVAGDMQDNALVGRWVDLARSLLGMNSQFDFIVSTGDLVSTSDMSGYWLFFDHGREILARKLFIPAVGNHDSPSYSYRKTFFRFNNLFPLINERSEYYYNFTYHNVLFIGLNSTMLGDFIRDSGFQYRYTKQVIDEVRTANSPKWVFHFMHTPLFNIGSRHGWESLTYRDLLTTWDGFVDWSFGGHEHFYQRHTIMNGTGYIAVPPAGNYPERGYLDICDAYANPEWLKYPPLPSPPQLPDEEGYLPDDNYVENSEDGFVLVRIKDKQMEMETYGIGDWNVSKQLHLIDSFTYSK